jgi:hypothetical protein
MISETTDRSGSQSGGEWQFVRAGCEWREVRVGAEHARANHKGARDMCVRRRGKSYGRKKERLPREVESRSNELTN